MQYLIWFDQAESCICTVFRRVSRPGNRNPEPATWKKNELRRKRNENRHRVQPLEKL